MLQLDQTAPGFSLPDSEMVMKALSDYAGQWVLLYFYPKDDTPGCTVQATDFTETESDYRDLGVQVIGISPDNCFSHQEFAEKHGLTVTLLSDMEKEACESYAVWQEKEKDGAKRMGIVRSTFLLDGDGIIRYLEYGVTAQGHAQRMLQKIKELKSN